MIFCPPSVESVREKFFYRRVGIKKFLRLELVEGFPMIWPYFGGMLPEPRGQTLILINDQELGR